MRFAIPIPDLEEAVPEVDLLAFDPTRGPASLGVGLEAPSPAELLDEVPCQDGSGGIVPLPTQEDVQLFMEALSERSSYEPLAFNSTGAEADDLNDWYAFYEESEEEIPEWAEAPTELAQEFLSLCCDILGGYNACLFVYGLRLDARIASEDFHSVRWRPTLERLFDRLHINFTPFDGTTYPSRVADWWGSDRQLHPPEQTRIGYIHAANAYWWFRRRAAGNTAAGALLGLARWDTAFSLPLKWSEAVHTGLTDADVDAEVTPEAAAALYGAGAQLQAIADSFEEATDVAAGLGIGGAFAGLLAVGAGGLWGFPALLYGIGLGVAGVKAEDIGNDLRENLYDLAGGFYAAANRSYLHEACSDILSGINRMEFSEPLEWLSNLEPILGMDDEALTSLASAFSGSTSPIVLVPSSIRGDFNRFEHTDPTVSEATLWRIPQRQHAAYRLWREFVSAGRPTADVALTFDAVGIILEQVMNIDDVFLAAVDLLGATGALPDMLKEAMTDQGLGLLVDTAEGLSPARIVRFVVRQVLTDWFIEAMTYKGYSRECLYTIFCWTNSEKKRLSTAAALGTLKEYEGEAQHLIDEALWPIHIRDFSGALGSVISALVGSTTSTLEQLSPDVVGSLCVVRQWVALMSASCTIEDLEPPFVWDTPSSEPTLPSEPLFPRVAEGNLGIGGHITLDWGDPVPEEDDGIRRGS